MFLHESVKKCREELSMSQDQLMIELANNGSRVSRPTINRWEGGGSIPDANALAALSMIFKKPLRYFFASKVK